jgi:hypothetical protein
MNSIKQISKHFREVYFGGNWTSANLKDILTGVTWQQATTSVHSLNSIATLVFHINYYVNPVLKVLHGEELNASDKFSFDLQPITSNHDWQQLLDKVFTEAELFACQIEKLDEARLLKDFADPKYGNYYRNLFGIIEHTHYHLGQISLIKKILNENATD